MADRRSRARSRRGSRHRPGDRPRRRHLHRGSLPDALARPHTEVWTWVLEGTHPGWGFADPALGRTEVAATWTLPGTAPARIPLPADATVLDATDVFVSPGLATTAGTTTAGTSTAALRWSRPGAAPQGRLLLEDTTLTLGGPGIRLVWSTSPGVEVEELGETVRFTVRGTGEVRYRVAEVKGEAVIPSQEVFWAGIADRFRALSLPEPAVPFELRGFRDKDDLRLALYTLVGGSTAGALPGRDVLRPRKLNEAWKSGWSTPVERGLILQMMLVQEKIPARWVLTGAAVDPKTLTGFDAVLVQSGDLWLDPGCVPCALGEIGTRYAGALALSAEGLTPLPMPSGRLSRVVHIEDTRFIVDFKAEGATALSLREALVGIEAARRPAVVAARLGLPGATILSLEGLDSLGGPISVRLQSDSSPHAPELWLPPGAGIEAGEELVPVTPPAPAPVEGAVPM